MLNKPMHCAIIDDDPADILLLKTFIDKATAGLWRFDEYEEFEKAAVALETCDFSIAFIDLNINGKSGLELIRRVVARKAPFPVVVVSALSDDELQEAAIAAGAYDFLPKDDIDEKTIKRMMRHVFSAFKKEQDLRRMADQALHGSAIKSSFLACMSHDLRTPLNAIIGFADVLHTSALGPQSHDHTTEYAGIISDSAKHLLELINAILDLSKIEQEQYTISNKWISLPDLLREQTRFLKPISDKKNITFDLQISHENYLLLCDDRALKQIFVNIMSNAVKFSQDNSKITVSTAIHDSKMHLMVSDTGIGMTSKEARLAVLPFGQVTQNPELARQGTGLGLTIVKGLVDAHGAELDISSRKGRGTRVSVIFPANRVSTQQKQFRSNTNIRTSVA